MRICFRCLITLSTEQNANIWGETFFLLPEVTLPWLNYSQRISLQDTSNKILKSHTLDSKERSILRFSEETLTLLL